jgi:hypothetical protein
MAGLRTMLLASSLLVLLASAAARAAEKPVAKLAARVFTLRTRDGDVSIPFESSLDLSTVHPDITQAAIVFHGKGRNVEGYYAALQRAAHEAGAKAQHTLLMAPQFLREEDIAAHGLSKQFLRWREGSWTAGEPATGPVSLSSFDLIDALLVAVADRNHFPNLASIILVGHSGGGQLLNRYAIVGTQAALLAAAGMHIRFVIANPSSFFYFDDTRPRPDGVLAPYADAASCPKFDRWRYGPTGAPPYVVDTSPATWQKREADYALADVIYLMGTDDTDPDQVDLDTSCAGEAEGPDRLDRGKAYFRYVQSRHEQSFRQQLWFVPDVAHFGNRMIDSRCGVAAVFDSGNCATIASP